MFVVFCRCLIYNSLLILIASFYMYFPTKLNQKLLNRINRQTLRRLEISDASLVDFYSNDYLGFASYATTAKTIHDCANKFLQEQNNSNNGATGSRLISGQSQLFQILETEIKQAHGCEAALLFNSGYDANLGLLSSIGQRHDVFLYDELSHASMRDGMRLSLAKAFSFKHNDLAHLEVKLKKHGQKPDSHCYVVTESVFSMDGDSPDLPQLVELCEKYQAYLIVDEAHAIGVFDYGLLHKLKLTERVFATVITFGKAMGTHGAVILGTNDLRDYLINYAHSFIYSTALAPHALASIKCAYQQLQQFIDKKDDRLKQLIAYFKQCCQELAISNYFIASDSSIQSCIIGDVKKVKQIENYLTAQGFASKAIASPTVPKNQERLRFCLHVFNTKQQISSVLKQLRNQLIA